MTTQAAPAGGGVTPEGQEATAAVRAAARAARAATAALASASDSALDAALGAMARALDAAAPAVLAANEQDMRAAADQGLPTGVRDRLRLDEAAAGGDRGPAEDPRRRRAGARKPYRSATCLAVWC